MTSLAPSPCEVALRSRLSALSKKRDGRPVPEDDLVASVVAAGYPRELVLAALASVGGRDEAHHVKEGWLPGAAPEAGASASSRGAHR